jgi:hypothetical protein
MDHFPFWYIVLYTALSFLEQCHPLKILSFRVWLGFGSIPYDQFSRLLSLVFSTFHMILGFAFAPYGCACESFALTNCTGYVPRFHGMPENQGFADSPASRGCFMLSKEAKVRGRI